MTSTQGQSAPEAEQAPAFQYQTVHTLLRKRARGARRTSWGVLCVIGVLLGAGIWLVIYPPNVVPKESYKPRDYGSYSGYGDSGFGGVYGTTGDFADPVKVTKGELRLQEQLDTLQKRLDNNEEADAERTLLLTELKTKNATIENQLGEVKKSVEEVKEIPKQERLKWEEVVVGLTTRFGFAALVLLLMRFMSSIYRYHARMAAFYDAKADAFEACKEGDIQTLEKLSHILTPAAVDFYETPDSLVEHAVDLAKRATVPTHG